MSPPFGKKSASEKRWIPGHFEIKDGENIWIRGHYAEEEAIAADPPAEMFNPPATEQATPEDTSLSNVRPQGWAADINLDLFDAAKKGNISTVQALLDKGEDVNAKDKDSMTALMYAVMAGHTNIVYLLLDKGADVNVKAKGNKGGVTALILAAKRGHTDILQTLLNAGADVNAKDNRASKFLALYCYYVFDDYYKESRTALMYAARYGYADIVQTLLDNGADVNAEDKDNSTALMWAAFKGHEEAVKALLDNGADMNVRNKDGKTALVLARKKRHTKIIRLLKQAGAKEYPHTALAEDAPSGVVLVPAGEFTMGLGGARAKKIVGTLRGMVKYHDSSAPAHKVNVGAFYMDKYEVTNENYKKFVEATNHQIPLHWEDAGGDIPSGKEKHPVVFVNWEDASAYCKWASKRLPTEVEWEKAARGTDGRLFPWGDNFSRKNLNFDKSRKNDTTKVGSYPKGVSSYGCFDMAGNVWEWTADNYLPYPGNKHKDEFYGKERYVLRGGSYLDTKYDAVTTMRSKFTPVTDDENVGFRCAKSSP